MKNELIKSLKMIKILEIKNPTQYKNLLQYFLILSFDSIKYICQAKKFDEIIDIVNKQKF